MVTKDILCVILNWRTTEHTVSCLRDLMKCKYDRLDIAVVDNCSGDNALAVIAKELDKIDSPHRVVNENDLNSVVLEQAHNQTLLIQNNENYGYAGGNNVAISYAVRSGYRYVWLLNNDCRPKRGALDALLHTAEREPTIGFVGSVLLNESPHDTIQSYGGGKIYPWIGKSRLLLKNQNIKMIEQAKLPVPDYIMGASMLVNLDVVVDVGLMSEVYFMYSEEADWQYRAKLKGWRLMVAKESLVVHLGSASTNGKRYMYHYYRNRAAIMFTRKFYGTFVATVAAFVLTSISLVETFGSVKAVKYGIKGIWAGLFKSFNDNQQLQTRIN